MLSKLRVTFDDPADGWVGLKLMDACEEIEILASYTPHNSFLDLVNALYNVFLYEGEWKVDWNEEPIESELHFRRNGSVVSFEVLQFADHRRGLQPTSRLKKRGSYEEVALPFWRALRKLQVRFSGEELNVRWHRNFPSKEMEELTYILKASS
jgi:hypothetical protein